jgi:hypothetical protein
MRSWRVPVLVHIKSRIRNRIRNFLKFQYDPGPDPKTLKFDPDLKRIATNPQHWDHVHNATLYRYIQCMWQFTVYVFISIVLKFVFEHWFLGSGHSHGSKAWMPDDSHTWACWLQGTDCNIWMISGGRI